MDELKLKEQSEKLREFHREITNFYCEFAKSFGLTYASLGVLCIIGKKKAATQKAVSEYIGLPKQTINAIIKGFQKSGFIETLVESNKDKRNKEIILSQSGQELADKVFSLINKIDYTALGCIGEEKRNILIEAVEIYKNNLRMI
ncbi:MAG: hypothetical protein LUG16_02300 [Candidatus Gastranaerophilales bacterium]|nr:hypothetical protein [Candidatus Gastranaerophilales bacterium]